MDTTKNNATRVPTKDPKVRLAKLEDRLANELMGIEERAELRDRVLRLRRRLAS